MQEHGVGLIGYGLSGSVFHAPFLEVTQGLKLRAVVSRNPVKVLERWPEVQVVSDVSELLARTDIDLVIVASPDPLHAEHAIAALESGRHVLLDKPFATTWADAHRISAIAQETGRLLTIFHNRRWDADFLTLVKLVAEGRFGHIVHFESHFDRWRPLSKTWKEGRMGGVWMDLGPHLIDQAICLFGMPNAVTADITTMREGAPAPDWFHVVLHYERRRVVLHSSKMAVNHGLRFAVHGTRGSWIKHGLDTQEAAILAGVSPTDIDLGVDPISGIFTPADAPHTSEEIENERGDYRQFWCAVERALAGAEANPVPASEALPVMMVLEAGIESAARRITVTI